MKRCLRMIVCLVFFACLMHAMALTSLAIDKLVTNDSVNFRTGPSLEASVITTLETLSSVEIIEHDPAGWSKVKAHNTVGYVKSDFLTVPSGAGAVIFRTTDNVNFRKGPSLDADVIMTLDTSTGVEMLEHNPGAWSKVKTNDKVGYIRSDFLTVTENFTAGAGVNILKTNDGVNFRSGPSTSHNIIRTLNVNTEVEVLERDPDGWSKVRHQGTIGYIRSDFLSKNGRKIELLEWSVVRTLIEYRTTMRVYDVRTGISYNIQCFSKGDHADIQTVTKADTNAHSQTHNGIKSWSARPVWVTIGDRTVAASLHGMPHDVSWIPDNGMDGHLCLHFLGSVTSSNSASYKADLQNAVQEAWNSR